MNVLVDRHHAALLYSLQLLFEDRLGMVLYVPQGHEWWDAGFWRFGQGYGDDRLAQQFLMDTAPVDPHYPDRLVRGVTLEDAQNMPWDFVVATVQDNQAGFAQFASEHDAQYVLQIGNIHQLVDWHLNPLVLNSTSAPILGRGINYHPEFDAHFRAPLTTKTIRSFVNCFESTRCGSLAPPEVMVYGIDGRDGNVEDYREVADLMAASGWGWHDKIQGDGYGFVIHAWAATGRPIIGHATHYLQTGAESFWQDGITSLDLNRHSVEEVMERVRTISPDEHHAMCDAIRAEFDRLVDFEAEAEAIADLLGVRLAVAA